MARSDEYVLEALLTFDKLGVVVHELLAIEAWKEVGASQDMHSLDRIILWVTIVLPHGYVILLWLTLGAAVSDTAYVLYPQSSNPSTPVTRESHRNIFSRCGTCPVSHAPMVTTVSTELRIERGKGLRTNVSPRPTDHYHSLTEVHCSAYNSRYFLRHGCRARTRTGVIWKYTREGFFILF